MPRLPATNAVNGDARVTADKRRSLRPCMPPVLRRIAPRRQGWLRLARPAPALFVLPALGAVLLGVPAGLLWTVSAPRAEVLLTAGGTVYAHPQPSAVIAADGWFAVLAGVTGLACGIALYVVGRRHLRGRMREVAALGGLTFGGLLGSLTAAHVGRLVAMPAFQERIRTAPPGANVPALLELQATGLVVLWPIAAVVVFTACLAAGTARGRQR